MCPKYIYPLAKSSEERIIIYHITSESNLKLQREGEKLGKTRNMKLKIKKWSQGVTEGSNSLDLESGVFTLNEPREIAKSLKKSAEASLRRKGTAYQSAMSMLNFYINRAGKNLSPARRKILERAKIELRNLFKKNC
jgi:hypothetical protein